MKIKQLLFISLLCIFFNSSQAMPLTGGRSEFYYEIGGARSILLPPNAQVRTRPLRGALELGFGYSCGNFNFNLGLLNALKGVIKNMAQFVKNAAVGALSSLPALILQRVNPGLYDLVQGYVIKAEAVVALANKSCEDYEADIKKGNNPYSNWTDLAKSADWKVQMGKKGYSGSSTDVVTAKSEVQRNNGKNGVSWIGGKKKGGKNDPPIKTTFDVVKAGFNITMNRAPDADQTSIVPLASSIGRGDQVFKTSKEVGDWAVDVLGDVYVKTYDNHVVETTPGHGLLPKISKAAEVFETKIIDLVNGVKPLSIENLGDASSSSVAMTRDLIEAIQSFDRGEQGIIISKLSSESAMASVMEKALFVRRFLLTGAREPNVAYTDAHQYISNNVAQIDREIEDILFEKRVQKEVLSETPALVMKLKNKYEKRGSTHQKRAGSERKIIEDGAVTP